MKFSLAVFVALAFSLTGCNLFGSGEDSSEDMATPDMQVGDGVIDSNDADETLPDSSVADLQSNDFGDGPDMVTPPGDMALPPDLPADADFDGVLDADDNCPNVANADQTDTNGDGIGDVCSNLSCSAVCDVACVQAGDLGCVTLCGGGSSCTYSCSAAAAECEISCAGQATCAGTCEAGGCTMECRGQSNCTFDCPGGGCTFVCGTSQSCVTTCTGGGCLGP